LYIYYEHDFAAYNCLHLVEENILSAYIVIMNQLLATAVTLMCGSWRKARGWTPLARDIRKLRVTSPDKQASMHAPWFGTQSKQSTACLSNGS